MNIIYTAMYFIAIAFTGSARCAALDLASPATPGQQPPPSQNMQILPDIVQNPFNLPEAPDTLAVATAFKESQFQFMGGTFSLPAESCAGCESGRVSFSGRRVPQSSPKENLITLHIPGNIEIAADRSCLFSVPGIAAPLTREQLLKLHGRSVISPFETDPAKTLYMDTRMPGSMETPADAGDYIDLRGSITRITSLPDGLKVKKILIQYLGTPIMD